jgi:Replication-relaxation
MTSSTVPATPASGRVPVYLPGPVRAEAGVPVRRAQLAVLAAHLTARDQWLLAMVHEHKVLTSAQIHSLAFGGARTMRKRLVLLTVQLRVLDRFRPLVALGTAPEHYVLGPAGAAWLAAAQGVNLKAFGYHRHRAHQIAASRQLAHTVGTNAFFTALAAGHRTDPASGQLAAWWSEKRCLRLWSDLARPDGYGHYTLAAPGADPAAARHVRFFLEYDTGTEALTRLPAKLPGYARLAAATGRAGLVLFYLPSATREENLHALFARERAPVPVATTSPDALTVARSGPAGPVWRPVTARPRHRAAERLPLIDLDALAAQSAARRTADQQAARPSWWTEPPPPLPPP